MENADIRPLSGTIGAEIRGIDLAEPLSQSHVELILAKLLEYRVLFFLHQHVLTAEQHVALGAAFGPLETEFPSFTSRLGVHPEVVFLDANRPNGRASMWHTDVSVSPTPPMGCIMQVKEVPERGGDTMWADLCAAYDALSTPMREFLERLTAIHDMVSPEYNERHEGIDLRERVDMDFSNVGRAEHPVVRVHPQTGRRCLFVNRMFTSHIVGLQPAENALLLNFLYSHIERPEFICRKHWSKGDVAFWDNRCTAHCAVDDYGKASRVVFRVSIKGDAPRGVGSRTLIDIAVQAGKDAALDFTGTVFMESSVVNAVAHRLNWRAEVLIARHPEAIVGKRVLDLASHDGRFSYAALACGARHVVGVEGREKHVLSAYRNLQRLSFDRARYEFVTANLVEFLRQTPPDRFDTILCFGVFSHLIEQVEVLREIRRIAPEYFILDTYLALEKRHWLERLRNHRVNEWVDATQLGSCRGGNRLVRLIRRLRAVATEDAYRSGALIFVYENADADGATLRGSGLIAWATPSLVGMLLEHFGFEYRMVDWCGQGIHDWTDLMDYRKRERGSWVARLPQPG